MYKLTERKAGEFIDLENYFATMDGDIEAIEKFFVLLLGRMVTSDSEVVEVITQYATEVAEIKENFQFIYNPPSLPSTTTSQDNTIGDEYRKEFTEMYGGYVELVYLLCQVFKYKPEEVLNMTTQDFLFWGNYNLHKKYVEQIK